MSQKLSVSMILHADKTNSLQADLDQHGKENGIEILQQEFDYRIRRNAPAFRHGDVRRRCEAPDVA